MRSAEKGRRRAGKNSPSFCPRPFCPIIFLFLLLINAKARAQGPENLVFEGAGIRGIAYAGAIEALEKQGLLKGVKRIGGTSAGAITALLLALGYSSGEITEIVHRTPYRQFNDGRFGVFGGIRRMKRYYGWYRGRNFEKWLARLIEARTGNADIRFGEWQRKGFPALYLTGTSLNRQQTVVFSHESFPNMKVRDAVRISMSIPLYFEAVFMTDEGEIVSRPRDTRGLNVMVDGGITANFPIHLFDSARYIAGSNPASGIHPGTLGFRIDHRNQIMHDSLGKSGLAPIPIDRLHTYIRAFYSSVIENLNRHSLTPEDWKRTVSIDDGGLSPRIRRLKRAEVRRLVDNGRRATEEWLNKKNRQDRD